MSNAREVIAHWVLVASSFYALAPGNSAEKIRTYLENKVQIRRSEICRPDPGGVPDCYPLDYDQQMN